MKKTLTFDNDDDFFLGYWLLAIGYWLLAIGCWLLANG